MKKTVESEEYINLIQWLKENRLSRNVALRELAGRTGMQHTHLFKIEANQRRLDVYQYVLYCRALGLDPAEGLGVFSQKSATKS